MLPIDRLIILRDEFHRAVTNPLFDEPEKYSVLLDVIQDAIDKEERSLKFGMVMIDDIDTNRGDTYAR